MRLWSIHPQYLDSKGLVALWRESLLAQNVLLGKTKGYKNHPQLIRFRETGHAEAAIASYLSAVADEADRRGYNFNREKIVSDEKCDTILVNSGQLKYEFSHLLNKLKVRDPIRYEALTSPSEIQTHPLFTKAEGEVEHWEVIQDKI